jgi:hypothetical protein
MPRKDPEARKAYQREYAQRNRKEAYERIVAWRKANPKKWAEQQKRYAKKYPEKLVAKSIKWKANNPEAAAASSRKTRLKNKARVNANKAMYRANKRNRTPLWLTPVDFERIQNVYKLAELQTKITGELWHVDHIIPLNGKNVSGLHVPSNLRAVRASENMLKNNKFEVEYA